MELALVRSLMDKDFYDDHRGARCPNRLFSKDVRKVKEMLDLAIDKYNRDVTPDEVEALFMSNNPSMTTAQKVAYGSMFAKIKKKESLGKDVPKDVLDKMKPKFLKNSEKKGFKTEKVEKKTKQNL